MILLCCEPCLTVFVLHLHYQFWLILPLLYSQYLFAGLSGLGLLQYPKRVAHLEAGNSTWFENDSSLTTLRLNRLRVDKFGEACPDFISNGRWRGVV